MPKKSIILTPNKRLARELQQDYCLKEANQGKNAWDSAKIMPIKTWMVEYWSNIEDPRTLLSQTQEKLLWQKIIGDSLGEKFISLTDLAMEFHDLVNSWKINTNDIFIHLTENNANFKNIYEAFKKICITENLITNSELPDLIIPYLNQLDSHQITLAGFDEYSLQLQDLINAFENNNCRIIKTDTNNITSAIHKRISCNNLKDEIYTAANWAKKILKGSPSSNIGIVVPNLVSIRPKIVQIFTETFGCLNNINISAGIPFNSLPIIHSAITILSLRTNTSISVIKKIIGSPYIKGTGNEAYERILFIQQLTELTHNELSLEELKKNLLNSSDKLPIFLEIIEKHQETPITNDLRLLCSEWIKIFTKTLKTFGWPGEKQLTELEAKAAKQFMILLQELSSSDSIIGKISINKMLQIIQSTILYNTLQPNLEHETSINIFGALEASGINFDHLWIMGVDQDNWPRAPKPNPFIPISIQKKLSLPHSSAERELDFYTKLIARFKRSAKEIIFSFVNQSDDRTIEPSFLIKDLSQIDLADLELESHNKWNETIFISKQIDQITDDTGPKIQTSEIKRSGSRLLELQSLCPFRAFVEFRLLTQEPIKKTLGVNKIDRGIVLHSALEKFWKKINTHDQLCKLTDEELKTLITDNITSTLNKLHLSETLHQLEKQNLIKLLTKWIAIEKKRIPFKVISIENSLKIELASIPIKIRIDRVDQLDNGQQLLIDYKSGKTLPSVFDLFGDRPQNPQLLLYSIALNSIETFALAQININSIKFKEFSLNELVFALHQKDENSQLPQKIEWQDLIKYWENVLNNLALNFKTGQAQVNPLTPSVCKQCSFNPICRITF